MPFSDLFWRYHPYEIDFTNSVFSERMTEERLRRTVAQIPVGRPGRPTDIAAAVRYLASAEASYVTGQVHHVNGGWVFER